MRGRERGAALVCALVLMLAAMLVGVSVCRAVFASIASASAGRERSLAYGAAEAALLDAERDIAGTFAGADPARTARFTVAGAGGFLDGCGHGGSGLGLCRASSPPAWQTQDLADPDNASVVPYGHYTGANLATGKGLLPARPPAYLIEQIAAPGAGASLGSFYRITAIGFGSHAVAQVVLQAVVRKPAPDHGSGQGDEQGNGHGNEQGSGQGKGAAAAPPVRLPAGRIAWREIPNWPQLHAQATK
jgi:type IV pilus assembly protein PilX